MALIKCPECGGVVSDRAQACPKCGFPIQNEVRKCPECGSAISGDGRTCPQCGFPIGESEVSYFREENSHPANEKMQDGPNPQDASSEERGFSKKGLMRCLFVVISLCLAFILLIANRMNVAADKERTSVSSSAKGKGNAAAQAVNPWRVLRDGDNVRLISCKLENTKLKNDNRDIYETVNAVFYILYDKQNPSASRFWISIPRVERLGLTMWNVSCYRAESLNERYITSDRNVLSSFNSPVLALSEGYGFVALKDNVNSTIVRSLNSCGMIMALFSYVSHEYLVSLYIPGGLSEVIR